MSARRFELLIDAFADEWVRGTGTPKRALTQAELADKYMLVACVTHIVDEAVREAILATARAVQPLPWE
jgi:hypothetical protein